MKPDLFCPSASVAVIGNGPINVRFGKGLEIDQCDYVVRFNNYQLQGHEGTVGRRESVWATTFNQDIEPRNLIPIDRIVVVYPLLDPRFLRRHMTLASSVPQLQRVAELLSSYGSGVEIIPFQFYENVGRLSAGMLFLYWLYVCRGWSLDGVLIEGFAFFDPGVRHHYWKEDGELPVRGAHSSEVEREFFRKMMMKEIR